MDIKKNICNSDEWYDVTPYDHEGVAKGCFTLVMCDEPYK